MHVKHVEVKSPHVGVMWKFGRGVIIARRLEGELSAQLPFACRILLRRAVWFTLKMNSDSENECLIEERSSDEEFSSSESESDDDCLDSARDRCQIDVTSPLPSYPKFPFTGNPGIKVCIGDSGDPFEYFNLFLDDEMFSFIVEETNRYTESFFENAELTPSSRALKWKNMNKEEMKRFIALLLLQGVVQKPVEQWFWSKRPILSTPFFGSDGDEAHFWLNGYINKQNCRIWSEAKTQVYVETPLHPEKLTGWCALWAGGILLQKR
ncbi:piggyBac transposable element-derived protein 4 [Trichonephila clavipes]|nr:piggyBac transposable element-derived protein 4 [Trichonephila clavipes]